MPFKINNIFEQAKFFLFALFFGWIAFFPATVHKRFGLFMILFLGLCFLLVYLLRPEKARIFTLRDWPLWLFLVVLLFNIANAVNKSLAFQAYLNIAVTFAVIFYIGKLMFCSLQNRLAVCMVVSVFAFIVAGFGLFEFLSGENILYEKFIQNSYYARYSSIFPRPMSTLLNPAILGSFVMGCLPFSLVFCDSEIKFNRIYGTIAVITSVVIILLTASRGVFISFIALCGFYLWKSNKKKIFLISIFILILFISFCSLSENRSLRQFGFNKVFHGSFDSSISSYRTDRFIMAVGMAREYPFSGVGLKHFRPLFNKYSKYSDGSIEPYELMIADNMYLSLLAETGFLGLLAFLTLVFLLIKRGLHEFNAEKGSQAKLIILAPLCALAGLLVNMGAYDLFYWENPLMLFAIICGFIAVI